MLKSATIIFQLLFWQFHLVALIGASYEASLSSLFCLFKSISYEFFWIYKHAFSIFIFSTDDGFCCISSNVTGMTDSSCACLIHQC